MFSYDFLLGRPPRTDGPMDEIVLTPFVGLSVAIQWPELVRHLRRLLYVHEAWRTYLSYPPNV